MKLNRKLRDDKNLESTEFYVAIPLYNDPSDPRVIEPIKQGLKNLCSYKGKRYLGMKYLGIKDDKYHLFQAMTD